MTNAELINEIMEKLKDKTEQERLEILKEIERMLKAGE